MFLHSTSASEKTTRGMNIGHLGTKKQTNTKAVK